MRLGPSAAFGRSTLVLLLVSALLALGIGPPALADPLPSEGKLKEAESRAAELKTLVADARTELASIERDLERLERELAAAQAELDAATEVFTAADRAATEAVDRYEAAVQALREAQAELADSQETLGDLARDTYKYGLPASSPVIAVLGSVSGVEEDEEQLADRLHYLQRGIGVRAVALERSEALHVEVEHLTQRADAEAQEAEQAREVAEAARDEAARLHTRVADLTAETSDKMERSAQLVAALEAEQEEVATRVQTLRQRVAEEKAERERREREERERRERERRERERREREERERREREAAQQRASSSGRRSSGGSSGGGTSIRPGPNGNLVTVGGITVAASLGPKLQALLDDARAAGIVLGGHGYRSPEVTARLRKANGCPDVYNSPASACRVPTARPGTSQHEKGLAIDFTWQGQTICYPRPGSQCRGNAAYNWLTANAHRYGLKNLPSEAWHWSTTGR